jgi:hypothetical protein
VVHDADSADLMRHAARLARRTLDLACSAAEPGVTSDEVDTVVHEAIIAVRETRRLSDSDDASDTAVATMHMNDKHSHPPSTIFVFFFGFISGNNCSFFLSRPLVLTHTRLELTRRP